MELTLGYRKTEVGMIPEDWSSGKLEEFFSFISYGFTNPMPTVPSGIYMITAADIGDGKVQYESARFTSEVAFNTLLSPKSKPKEDDILLTKDGSLGRLALVSNERICINQSVAVIRPNDKVVPEFLKLLLESPIYQKKMIEDAGGSTIKHIYITIVNLMTIALPRLLPEQRAIAAVLSDVDAMTASLDRLIAKKRDMKQATMQELLTGKRRLPGFCGEWEVRSLCSIVVGLEAGVSVNSIEDSLSNNVDAQCILKTSSIHDGKFFPDECKLIAPKDVRRARQNPIRDTILISRMNTPDLVGEVGYVDDDYPNLFLPDRLWMTRFGTAGEVCARWLAYLLCSTKYKKLIKSTATGTSGSMKNISKSILLSLDVPFPSHSEQTAIATILSDMDADIATMEQKLEKTRMMKQGMMQELLTGRIRLV